MYIYKNYDMLILLSLNINANSAWNFNCVENCFRKCYRLMLVLQWCAHTRTYVHVHVQMRAWRVIQTTIIIISWWRHQMETFSALLAICAGNSPVPGDFPAQRQVTRSFDVFFDLRLNNKQSWGWWFETLSRPLWRHCNIKSTVTYMKQVQVHVHTAEAILCILWQWRPRCWTAPFQMTPSDGHHTYIGVLVLIGDEVCN